MLQPSKMLNGFLVAGRCSICHRPFEVDAEESDLPPSVRQELVALFEDHTCNEDVNQAAAPIITETPDK
jgi:hypothetical protein